MIKAIKNEEDYIMALSRVELLMDVKVNSSEFHELNSLATLIEDYEDKYYTIDVPDSEEVVKTEKSSK